MIPGRNIHTNIVRRSQPINIHVYDRLIDTSSATEELARAYNTPKAVKLRSLEILLAYVIGTASDLKTDRGIACMRRLIADFKRTPVIIGALGDPLPRPKSGPNWDPTNHLFADDLLFLCGEKIIGGTSEDSDMVHILNLQFTEMATGMCPQGRATRMWQLYITFPDPKEDMGVSDESE